MNFGDWEMFRVLIVSLREHEMTTVIKQHESKRHPPLMHKQQSSVQTRERKSNALFKFIR